MPGPQVANSAGFQAALRGLGPGANPFPHRSPLRAHWTRGHALGEAHKLRLAETHARRFPPPQEPTEAETW